MNLYRSLVALFIVVFIISNTAHPNPTIIQSAQKTVAAIVWQQPLAPDQLTSVIKKSIFKATLELGNKDIALYLLRTEQEIFERAALINNDQEFGGVFDFSKIASEKKNTGGEQQPAAHSIIWAEIEGIQKTIQRRELSEITRKEMPQASSNPDPYWTDWYAYQKALNDKRYFNAYQIKMHIINNFTSYASVRGTDCSICLQKILAGPPDYPQNASFQLAILACGHYFHKKCLGEIIRCPNCSISSLHTGFFDGFSFSVKIDPQEWLLEHLESRKLSAQLPIQLDVQILETIRQERKKCESEIAEKSYLPPHILDAATIMPSTRRIAALIKSLKDPALREKEQGKEDQHLLDQIDAISSEEIQHSEHFPEASFVEAKRNRILQRFACLSKSQQEAFKAKDDERKKEILTLVGGVKNDSSQNIARDEQRILSLMRQIIDDRKYSDAIEAWEKRFKKE